MLLPLQWDTIVRHVLLHLVEFIRRCGPFKDHSMLSFERWHTMFKGLSRGHREVWTSLANHFNMLWSSNVWACKSQGGDELTVTPFRSTISGKKEIDYYGDGLEVEVKRTKITKRTLHAPALGQVTLPLHYM